VAAGLDLGQRHVVAVIVGDGDLDPGLGFSNFASSSGLV
jgi:hypothetical protein